MQHVTGNYRVHGVVPDTQKFGIVLILKEGDKLIVHPEIVHIGRTGRVSWWFWHNVVPEGGRVEIEFDEQDQNKGPFKERGDTVNKNRGFYSKGQAPSLGIIADGVDKPPSSIYWKYSVKVYDCPKDGEPKTQIDPGVAIDPG